MARKDQARLVETLNGPAILGEHRLCTFTVANETLAFPRRPEIDDIGVDSRGGRGFDERSRSRRHANALAVSGETLNDSIRPLRGSNRIEIFDAEESRSVTARRSTHA